VNLLHLDGNGSVSTSFKSVINKCNESAVFDLSKVYQVLLSKVHQSGLSKFLTCANFDVVKYGNESIGKVWLGAKDVGDDAGEVLFVGLDEDILDKLVLRSVAKLLEN
jgi:hypothetical protein